MKPSDDITTVELLAGITPGTWRVDRYDNVWSGNVRIALCDGPTFKADRGDTPERREANARFIAAAPTLISNLVKENEILRAVLEWVANHAAKLRNGTDDWFGLVEFEAMARDALRSNLDKEEGDTPSVASPSQEQM